MTWSEVWPWTVLIFVIWIFASLFVAIVSFAIGDVIKSFYTFRVRSEREAEDEKRRAL